jgi:hypothetical protein
MLQLSCRNYINLNDFEILVLLPLYSLHPYELASKLQPTTLVLFPLKSSFCSDPSSLNIVLGSALKKFTFCKYAILSDSFDSDASLRGGTFEFIEKSQTGALKDTEILQK